MKTVKDNIAAAAALIKKNSTFIFSTHRNPDADALGSELALGIALRRIGKEVTIFNMSETPENLRFLPDSERIKTGKRINSRFNIAVLLDCESFERCGYIIKEKNYSNGLLFVDHHKSNTNLNDNNIIVHSASSTSELVYYLIKKLGVPIDHDIATCIYTGIFYDTGGLRYSNVSPEVFKICAELVAAGVEAREISRQLYETKSYNSQRLLGLALSRLNRSDDGKVCWTYLKKDDFIKTATQQNDTEGFVNQLSEIAGVSVGIFFREIDRNCTKISFRSKDGIDVAKVASSFGGGGHVSASGCMIKKRLDKTIDMVLKEFA